MNRTSSNNIRVSLVDLDEKDLDYLRFIFQSLKKTDKETFHLGKLDAAWLTNDDLVQSAIHWKRYYWTRIIGWVVSISLVLPNAIALMLYGSWLALAFGAGAVGGNRGLLEALFGFLVTATLSPLIVVTITVLVARGIGHAIAFLLNLIKDNQFDPDPPTNSDYKAIQWALAKAGLLPKRNKKWLAKMVKARAIVEVGEGFSKLNLDSVNLKDLLTQDVGPDADVSVEVAPL
ncbi:MAG: hypothetical protein AAF902_02130 [Chloroflexota bacterium]